MLPDLLTAKSLISFYIKRLQSTSAWNIADRLLTYSRRFLLLTNILKYTAIVISIIETSAIFIVAGSFLILCLPVIFLVMTIVKIAGEIKGSKVLKKLDLRLGCDKIYVFFKTGNIGEKTAREISGDSAVFVVSNAYRHRFFTAKNDCGVIFINKSFFIRLRKTYFDAVPEKMHYIF